MEAGYWAACAAETGREEATARARTIATGGSTPSAAMTRYRRWASAEKFDLALLAAVLLWSLNFSTSKYALDQGFPPVGYAALRWALGAPLFVLGLRLMGLKLRFVDFKRTLTIAIIGVLINQVALVYAQHLTTAGTVALCFGTAPVFAVLLSHFRAVEPMQAVHIVAAALSFAGVAFVATGNGLDLRLAEIGGVLLALVAAACFAFFSVAVAGLASDIGDVAVVNAAASSMGAAMLLVASVPGLTTSSLAEVSGLAWAAFGFGVIGALVAGNFLWLYGITGTGPSRGSFYMNLQPFLGAAIAAIILSETLSTGHIIGGVLILSSIILVRTKGKRRADVGPATNDDGRIEATIGQ
jgi:drug/metabolite transporter (DMT)-like permease